MAENFDFRHLDPVAAAEIEEKGADAANVPLEEREEYKDAQAIKEETKASQEQQTMMISTTTAQR